MSANRLKNKIIQQTTQGIELTFPNSINASDLVNKINSEIGLNKAKVTTRHMGHEIVPALVVGGHLGYGSVLAYSIIVGNPPIEEPTPNSNSTSFTVGFLDVELLKKVYDQITQSK